MKTLNKILSQKEFNRKLCETANVEYATMVLYTLCEQYQNASSEDILNEFDKHIQFNSLYNKHQNHIRSIITQMFEESIPTNMSAGIDSSTPRISNKSKENIDVVRRTKKDKTQIQ